VAAGVATERRRRPARRRGVMPLRALLWAPTPPAPPTRPRLPAGRLHGCPNAR